MSTPNIDITAHDHGETSNNSPTTIALVMPSPSWHGQVEAVIHAYDPSEKSTI